MVMSTSHARWALVLRASWAAAALLVGGCSTGNVEDVASVGKAQQAVAVPGYTFGAAADYNAFVLQDLSVSPNVAGPVAAGRDISAQSFGYDTSAAGSIGAIAGRNFTGANGSVKRDLVYGNALSLSNVGVLQGISRKGTPLDFATEKTWLNSLTANLANFVTNGSTAISADASTITFTGTNSALNVFTVAGSALGATDVLRFVVPSSATVLVNVTGASAVFETTGMQLGGLTPGHLVWNFPNASTVHVAQTGFKGTLLAVNAAVSQSSSVLDGVLIGNSLTGGDNGLTWQAFNGVLPSPLLPKVTCVNRFDATHLSAVFSYENQAGQSVTVPTGVANQLSPSAGVQPPSSFLPGVHDSVFVVPFTTSVSWTILGRTVVANASSPACTLEQYAPAVPQRVSAEIPGEGSTRGSSVARSRLVPGVYGPGLSYGALPARFGTSPAPAGANGSGTSGTGGTGVVQQGLAAAAPFTVTITEMRIGNDAACWGGDPFVQVSVKGELVGAPTIDTDCSGFSACASQYFPNIVVKAPNVSPSDTTVPVRLVLIDRDTYACGGSDDEHPIDTSFNVNNIGDQSNCADGDGWRLCWTIHPNGRPKACMTWNAQYEDAGNDDPSFSATEDYLGAKGVQKVPASAAIAELSVLRGATVKTFSAPLDTDGCFPPEALPEGNDLTLPAVGDPNKLTVKISMNSEFCLDPSNNGCLDPSNPSAGRPKGARFLVHTAAQPAPAKLCTILTQDEALTDPSCNVIHASQGAFAAWAGASPPSRIDVLNPTETEVTRISGVVSTLLRREIETNGDIGIREALINRHFATPDTNVVDIAANDWCTFGPDENNQTIRDTCAGSTVKYRPDACCGGIKFGLCRADKKENCSASERFIEGDSYWKYVVAHEIGHVIQRRLTGSWVGPYGSGPGEPGAPPKCSCAHVEGANALHCLQSLEGPGAAQVEGFAQYFSSRTFNRDGESDCVFRYYKDFVDDSCRPGVPASACENSGALKLSRPPIPFSCLQPVKWRNNLCAQGAVAPAALTAMGVEIDWLGFYTAWSTRGADKSTIQDIANTYLRACGGAACGNGAGAKQVSFAGSESTLGLQPAAQAVLGLGSPKLNQFGTQSRLFGVDTSTAP